MNEESKRIFVGNLPKHTAADEVNEKFSLYGDVASVEIKTKKDAFDNESYFAFVHLRTDHQNLQKCLQDMSNNEWKKGHYVNVQMARESFLEKLKREREENAMKNVKSSDGSSAISNFSKKEQMPAFSNVEKNISSSSSESEDDTSYNNHVSKTETSDEEEPALVIKSNKGKTLNGNALKIESYGKPIYINEIKKPKSKDPKRSEADQKRIKSLLEMKKSYQQQRNLIKSALSKTDMVYNSKLEVNNLTKRKHKWNEDDLVPNKKLKSSENRLSLFEEENEELAEQFNFDVGEQFVGKKGKKLLELQSKFNYDKRFTIDSRFLDDEEDEQTVNNNIEDQDLITYDEEKQNQLKILGDILGESASKSLSKKNMKITKSMLRFNPSAIDHTKYELQKSDTNKTSKTKEKVEKTEEEIVKPVVSQEGFFKVNENLKQSLQNKEGEFSLLNMFGRVNDDNEENYNNDEETYQAIEISDDGRRRMKNVMPLDSSDEEAVNNVDIPVQSILKQQISWNENFFFTENDERFQEGLDFFEKLKVSKNTEFRKLRQNLKDIVRTKVRHHQRKNKSFKRKLGGKRLIKLKKALKR